MKKYTALFAMMLAFGIAHADPAAKPTAEEVKSHSHLKKIAAKDNPCHPIKEACEKGGYTKSSHNTNGKGLFKDCEKAIIEGTGAPEGVDVTGITAEQTAACKERVAAVKADRRQAKKEAKQTW